MLVKINRPVKGYGYFGGETAELSDDIAAKFINDGAAIMIQKTEGVEEDNLLPEGLPMRDLLYENGYDSVEQILNARGTLTDVKGIGEASAKRIIEFCEQYEG